MADGDSDETVLEGVGAYFLSVVEASQDCIRVISPAGRIEYMNTRGKQLLEIDDFEAHNRDRYWPDMWHAESRAAVETALQAALEGRAVAFRAYNPTAKGAPRWWETMVSPILVDGRVVRVLATSRDVTSARLAERHRQLLVNELNHRVKNTLATIQSITKQSLRNAGVDGAVRDALEGRLMAIAATHNVLTDQNWSAASLRQIVDGSVTPYRSNPAQLTVTGPDLKVSPKTAVIMALAFHELAINALKYGALSAAAGHVDVTWTIEPEDHLHIEWRESGGPPVQPPERRGFGSRIVQTALPGELAGTVSLDYRAEGLRCAIDAPLSSLDKADAFMPLG
ncbi:PAS domain S-box protein [Caulobacter segnis]|uniref:histidine kinase n=2 Tax=Caulobacter segnis TaxID=88688 RepID=D5VFA5_CAUST|nr:HWE histidine kinase domain-containing protein [Caulobacter segnis]ADG09637.1 signal transduction histidine kinase [Caulobacter segnis ATCC 21756]AVQ01417.1 PAS domain S-box protein [Caulobacter segnis]